MSAYSYAPNHFIFPQPFILNPLKNFVGVIINLIHISLCVCIFQLLFSVKCNCLVQRKACIKCSLSFTFIKKEKMANLYAPLAFLFPIRLAKPIAASASPIFFNRLFFFFLTKNFLYCYFISETGKWYGLTAQYSKLFCKTTAQMTVIMFSLVLLFFSF